jgi:NTE family protein
MREPANQKVKATDGPTALVFGSGGARAAYEVGVARFLFEDLHEQLRFSPWPAILCGSSAGALNALALAAFADRPLHGVSFLARRWESLSLGDFLRPQCLEILRLVQTLLGCPPGAVQALHAPGGIFDARPLRKHVFAGWPADAINEHFAAGRIKAISLTATEIASGKTVMFLQAQAGASIAPTNHATTVVPVEVGPAHALASAAIPLLFPPVRIKGRAYCDGSLRQSVPLSAALHLGAQRILVVSTQHCPTRVSPALEAEREAAATGPLYLLGKAVNALTLDRIDDDLDRLTLINRLLAAGEQAFGPEFLPKLNRELGKTANRTVAPVAATLIRPSESLGRMAADHVAGRQFKQRNRGAAGRLFARLAAGESEHENDLLSYLLFDGPFASALMDLGYADARAQRAELAALFPAPHEQARGAPAARSVQAGAR